MHFIYLLFIALINSIDNIGIGIAYSIAGIKVKFTKNILIAFMAFAVSFIASYSGNIISHFLSEKTASILSMILISSMGIKIIYEAYSNKNEIDIKNPKCITYREAISTGTALALDDIGSSVGSGLIGYNAVIVALPYFIISFLIFFLGNHASKLFTKVNIGKKATIIAGILMIFIGISQVID